MLAVDVAHVLARILIDTLPGDLEDLRPRPELQGAGRAVIHAGRALTLPQPLPAHDALLDLRVRTVVLELRDVERARDHAEAAAHALAAVPGDRAVRRLVHRSRQAGRHAGRLQTVHALPLHRDRTFVGLVTVHDRPLGRRRLARLVQIDILLGLWQAVGLGAGPLAHPTAHATSSVYQYGHRFRPCRSYLGFLSREVPAYQGGAGGHADRLYAIPSIHHARSSLALKLG